MPLPLRTLPTTQNWDCQNCSSCCRTYRVPVSEAERKRIEEQHWDLGGVAAFHRERDGSYSVGHHQGACVFLGSDNRCRIHAKFGSAAKPLACRVYPFLLIPTGDQWRVGIKFACPSAAKNEGHPLADHRTDLQDYAAELEPKSKDVIWPPLPPTLQRGQAVPWTDLGRFTDAFVRILEARSPLQRRLRHIHALARQCAELRYDSVSGSKLTELLMILTQSTDDEVPSVDLVPPPGWSGRMIFRQLAAIYARQDAGPTRGRMSEIGWFHRMLAGYRFAMARGLVPPVNGLVPTDVTFDQGEHPAGPMPEESELLLTRYFRVKLESMQFFGRANFELPFWAGLDSLLFTFPVTLWLSRLLTTTTRSHADAIREALRIVDDSFGFNPLLSRKVGSGVNVLATKGELPRLIVWYSR